MPAVIAREPELGAVDELLDRGRRSFAALVLEGEAGIGKTTVWREGVEAARAGGYLVLEARASSGEAQIAHAALADLIRPVEDELLAVLPAPQQRALDGVLLRDDVDGEEVGERVVGTAVATLLRKLAERSPLLVALDDLQWLDATSARALEFALRRLEDCPVALLATRRIELGGDGDPSLQLVSSAESTRRCSVGPLSVAALHLLLRERLGHSLPRPVLVRVERLAGGNPFYALEIAQAIEAAGGVAAGSELPVPEDVYQLVVGRVRAMPQATREALLVLAAASGSRPAATLDESALGPAEDAGVVRVRSGRAEFTHPLFAGAVYGSATAARRREVHARLGAVLDDPEEQARHLALAALGPDRTVAVALDAGATRARARGAPQAAAELQERAARLTPSGEEAECCRRLLAAARHAFHAGARGQARALADEVLELSVSAEDRVLALLLLAEIRYNESSFADALALLERARGETQSDDLLVHVDIASAHAVFSVGDPATAMTHAVAALGRAAKVGHDAIHGDALGLVGVGQLVMGDPAGWELLDRAFELEDRTRSTPIQLRPSVLRCEFLLYAGSLAETISLVDEIETWFVERGAETDVPFLLLYGTMGRVQTGRYDDAIALASRSLALSEQTASHTIGAVARVHRARALASLGRIDEARADLQIAIPLLEQAGWVQALAVAMMTLAFVELTAGSAAADDVVQSMVAGVADPATPWVLAAHAVGDSVEVLVGSGALEQAESLVEATAARVQALDLAWVALVLGRCRGLILAARGDLARALAEVEAAMLFADRVEHPLEVARTLLVQGQLERRLRRRTDARVSLERALAICEEHGAEPWAARVRADLERLGRRGDPGGLTATEKRIARLAAGGMTNAEVAAAAFVSKRTVDATLARVYAKLGIRSRAQLAVALASRDSG